MLFRVCEAARNADLNPLMVAQLHSRYQDVMVALLAIEQLTGAVQARQVILGGESRASALAGTLLDTTKRLAEAKTAELKAQNDRDAAQKKYDILNGDENLDGSFKKANAEYLAAQNAFDQQNTKVQQLQAQCTANPSETCTASLNAERGKLKPLQDDRDNKQTIMNQKKTERDNTRDALEQAKYGYERAVEARRIIEQLRGQAETNASAASSVSGEFETTVKYAPISPEVAYQVKGAVTDIVKTVIEKRHEIDACIVFLSYRSKLRTSAAEAPAERQAALNLEIAKYQNVEELCLDLISQLRK
jgi:hypothetical protein